MLVMPTPSWTLARRQDPQVSNMLWNSTVGLHGSLLASHAETPLDLSSVPRQDTGALQNRAHGSGSWEFEVSCWGSADRLILRKPLLGCAGQLLGQLTP